MFFHCKGEQAVLEESLREKNRACFGRERTEHFFLERNQREKPEEWGGAFERGGSLELES